MDIREYSAIVTRFARRHSGLSRRRFGELFEVTDKTIQRWERAETRPTDDVLFQIAALARQLRATRHNTDPKESQMLKDGIEALIASTGSRAGIEIGSRLGKATIAFVREMTKWSHDHPVDCEQFDTASIPPFVEKLKNLAQDTNPETQAASHEELAEYGPLFEPLINALDDADMRSRCLQWIAVGMQRSGRSDEARPWLEKANRNAVDPFIRVGVMNNLSMQLLLEMDFFGAREILETAKEIASRQKPTLYNMLCVNSLMHDLNGCREAEAELFASFPELSKDDSPIWKDPMLTFYRQNRNKWIDLADKHGASGRVARGSGLNLTALLVVATGILALASDVFAGMSCV